MKLAAVISIGTGEPSETDRILNNGSNIRAKAKYLLHIMSLLLEQVCLPSTFLRFLSYKAH